MHMGMYAWMGGIVAARALVCNLGVDPLVHTWHHELEANVNNLIEGRPLQHTVACDRRADVLEAQRLAVLQHDKQV